jgi:hypothetical protein
VDAARENAVAAASAVAAATVRARRAGLKSLIIGADGRASTSKAGALVWTYAVLFVLAYMLVVGRTPWLAEGTPHLPKFHTALADFIAAPFQPEYFALLGFPVAAAVTAKALTTNKVVQGQVDKSKGQNTGVASGLSELISNDSGQSDLLDFQYLAFNLFTLAYFFVSFATSAATNPKAGLPAIPATLLALSGVSAAGYLTKKAVESGVAPTITAVAPLRVVLNEDTALEIDGGGFLGGGNSVSPSNLVLLDGKVLPVRKQDWEDTHVVAQLPKGTADELTRLGWRDRGPDNPALVVVRDDSGNSSPAVQVEIALPKPAPAHRP